MVAALQRCGGVVVRVSYEVFKVPGELVLYCEHLQTVRYRDPANSKLQLQQE